MTPRDHTAALRDSIARHFPDDPANAARAYAALTEALAHPSQQEDDVRDAKRYRRIRNGPHSDRYGDLYAMAFQGDGDIPLKGDALDFAVDAAIAAMSDSAGEGGKNG